MATTNFGGDVTKQMSDFFTQGFEAGMKFNAEAAKFWSEMAQKSAETARSEWKRWTDGFTAATEKAMDRTRRLTSEQVERNGELLRDFGAAMTATTPAEMSDKWGQAWRRSVDTVQANFDAAAKTVGESAAEWTETARRETKVATAKSAK